MNVASIIVVVIVYAYAAILLLRVMGKFNFFVTLVPEGFAKAIVSGGGVERMVMQWEGHTFRGKRNTPEDAAVISVDPLAYWDVVADDGSNVRDIFGRILSQFGMRGLRWVGIPGVVSIYTYKFRWTSLFQQSQLP